MRIRLEDGTVYDSGALLANATPGWEWTRLETGEDTLLGPQTLTPVQTVEARLGPGDVAPIVFGHGS